MEKETRSRHAGEKLHENTLPAPSDGARDRSPREAGDGGQTARTTPRSEKRTNGTGADRQETPGQSARERLALAPNPDRDGLAVGPRQERERVPGAGDVLRVPGLPDADQGKRGDPARELRPDAGAMRRILGGPSPDRLDGVEEGEATALNTKSFRYAGFITRVGRAVFHEWDPNRPYQQRDPDRTMFTNKDRTTWVELVLNPTGALDAVKIAETSGLDFLDYEVVRAARAAAPFLNPPTGMVDPDGKVHVGLGFTLYAARNEPRFRVYLPAMPSQRPYPDR